MASRILSRLKTRLLQLTRPKTIISISLVVGSVLLFLFLSFSSHIPTPRQPESSLGTNLITNGGFETEEGWTYSTVNQYGLAGRDSSLVFEGNYSGKLEILKPNPTAAARPTISQSLEGFKVQDLANHSRAFGFQIRLNHYATFFETDGIEQIHVTISSSEGRDLTYLWADFPVGWNLTNHKFLQSRVMSEDSWFRFDRNFQEDWIRAGFPPDDTLTGLSISVSEPGSTHQGSDVAWIDGVHLFTRQKPSALTSSLDAPGLQAAANSASMKRVRQADWPSQEDGHQIPLHVFYVG